VKRTFTELRGRRIGQQTGGRNPELEIPLKQLILVSGTLLLAACQAQPLASPSASIPQSRGHAFAQASCAACHAVARGSTSSPNPNAPAFAAIVNQQGLTAETLSSWLRDAHNYPSEMEFQLDSSRADDLVAYMVTLRDPNYKPPPS
jgi:mono/diheme cytochrome c family protein